MSDRTSLEADVIIVGAGLSGMIAARKVLDAGLMPLILEAGDRVGGRILTEEVMPGVSVELGAQWIGDTHQRVFRLAEELGVQTYPQYDEGETSYDLGGSGVLRENAFRTRFANELGELERVLRDLGGLAWHHARPNGTSSRQAPGMTRRDFHQWPAPCWRSARSESWRYPPSRCPSWTCCSRSRPAV